MLYGRQDYIHDLVTSEGIAEKSLKSAFHEAVDGYLEFCEAREVL